MHHLEEEKFYFLYMYYFNIFSNALRNYDTILCTWLGHDVYANRRKKSFLCFLNFFLGVLLTVAPQRDNIISTLEFLEVSDFILAQNWEGNGPEIGVYGLSSVVYKGGFPTHLSNRQMNHYKAVSKFKNPYKHCSGKCLTFHIFILLSGDIATNPGPIRFPCGSCAKPVRSNQHGLQCDDCDM